MLSSIKDKTKGWVAYLIIALIAIPFALFGISKYFEGNINIVVANVGSDEISKEVYLKEFNRTKGRLQRELGKNYTAETDHQAKLFIFNIFKSIHFKQRFVLSYRKLTLFFKCIV
jgi:peptidyl-prolyl cis-trans isomerase D